MVLNKSVAESHSAITVVSAFASGKGVTIGIDLPCKVTAELKSRGKNLPQVEINGKVQDPHRLIETSVERSMEYLGVVIPRNTSLFLTVDSLIPVAVGLKSSSAVSVAVTKSVIELFSDGDAKARRIQEILRISCEASIQSGASLTGAFDDAAAGLLGGLVFADNLKFKLLRHEAVNGELGSIVKLLVPIKRKKLTSTLDLNSYHTFKDRAVEAIAFARKGIIVQAMLLNSIIHSIIHHYSMQPIVSSIMEGASASGVTGKGPAIAAICSNNKISGRVERRWREESPDSNVITTTVTSPRS